MLRLNDKRLFIYADRLRYKCFYIINKVKKYFKGLVVMTFLVITIFLIYSLYKHFKGSNYTLAISDPTTTLNPVGKILAKELSSDMNIHFDLIESGNSSFNNLKLVESGKADFTLASNVVYDTSHQASKFENVTTVLPLYRMALLVMYPDTLDDTSLNKLVYKKRVGLGPKNSNSATAILSVFKELGIDSSMFTPVFTSLDKNVIEKDKIEICCMFTGLFNPSLKNRLQSPNIKIFNFERNPDEKESSYVTYGICRKLWTNQPYIVPAHFFGNKPDQPIYTISLQCCLYANSKVKYSDIYSILESIANHKGNYIKKSSDLQDISFDLGNNYFFPINQGTINYLARETPSFWGQDVVKEIVFTVVAYIVSAIFLYYNNRKKRLHRFELRVMQLVEISRNPDFEAWIKLQKLKRYTVLRLKRGKLDYDSDLQNLLLFFSHVETHVQKMLEKDCKFPTSNIGINNNEKIIE